MTNFGHAPKADTRFRPTGMPAPRWRLKDCTALDYLPDEDLNDRNHQARISWSVRQRIAREQKEDAA